jgi:protein-S-isoprenylcysteine O-methyltransferase Ste14
LFEFPSAYGWPLLLSLSGIAVFGSFAWGLHRHFLGGKTPAAVHVINALSMISIAVFLFVIWKTDAPDWQRAVGFSLHLLAVVLFGLAVLTTRRKRPALAFAGDRPNHVFHSGPYSYIRHPFYTSYLLFWLGCTVATSSLISLILFLALAALYTVAALGEERGFSHSILHDEYEAYRKRTGFFWPKLRLASRQL